MKLAAKKYLRPLKPLMQRTGANFSQVAQLVDLKFLLDNRKKLQNRRSGSSTPKSSIFKQALSYTIIGVFLIIMMLEVKDPYFFIITCQLMLMVMNTITMLAEYSVTLFDTRDNNLILPLPANGQTVGWARVTHILLYLLLLSFSMMIPCIIFVFIKFSIITGLLFFISIFLTTLFTLFFTVFIYMALIKVTNGEKLKDVMMYLQVFLTIGIMFSYQILPRYFSANIDESFLLTKQWFYLAIPPAWFASFSTLNIQLDPVNIACAATAIILPIFGILKIGKSLFYGFNESLVKLDTSSGNEVKSSNKKTKSKISLWMKFTSILVGVKKQEIPIFNLMWRISGRERLFKQSLLPILSYAALMPVILCVTSNDLSKIESKYLPFLYFTIMSSSMLPSILTIGNNKNADWLYKTLPNIEPVNLFKASLKAVMAKFFIPLFIIVTLPLFYFNGAWAIIDIACILLFNLMIASYTLYFQTPHFAFTQEKVAAQGGKAGIKMALLIILAMPMGFLHFFLHKQNELLVLIPTAIYGVLLYLMNSVWMKRRLNWKYINFINNQF